MKLTSIFFFIFAVCHCCLAQNQFDFGIKLGYGSSVFPMDVDVQANQMQYLGKSGATLSTGILTRYLIADRFGLESGALLNHYSVYKTEDFDAGDAFWKTGADHEIVNGQWPLILTYKAKFKRHPFSYLTMNAGTSIDWFFNGYLSGPSSVLRPRSLQNIIGSCKFGKDLTHGQIEFGVDVHYSLKAFSLFLTHQSVSDTRIIMRMNSVGVSLSYWFLAVKQSKAS